MSFPTASINTSTSQSDLVQKFLKHYTVVAKNGKNIILCWIPSHVGILGNEKADATAKSALSLLVTRTCHSYEASRHRHVSSYN